MAVTRVAGGMVSAFKFVPRRVTEGLASALGGDTVFLDDVDARKGYLERIRGK